MTPAACAKHRETRGLVLKLEPGISGRDDNAIYTACTSSESSCHVGIAMGRNTFLAFQATASTRTVRKSLHAAASAPVPSLPHQFLTQQTAAARIQPVHVAPSPSCWAAFKFSNRRIRAAASLGR